MGIIGKIDSWWLAVVCFCIETRRDGVNGGLGQETDSIVYSKHILIQSKKKDSIRILTGRVGWHRHNRHAGQSSLNDAGRVEVKRRDLASSIGGGPDHYADVIRATIVQNAFWHRERLLRPYITH